MVNCGSLRKRESAFAVKSSTPEVSLTSPCAAERGVRNDRKTHIHFSAIGLQLRCTSGFSALNCVYSVDCVMHLGEETSPLQIQERTRHALSLQKITTGMSLPQKGKRSSPLLFNYFPIQPRC